MQKEYNIWQHTQPLQPKLSFLGIVVIWEVNKWHFPSTWGWNLKDAGECRHLQVVFHLQKDFGRRRSKSYKNCIKRTPKQLVYFCACNAEIDQLLSAVSFQKKGLKIIKKSFLMNIISSFQDLSDLLFKNQDLLDFFLLIFLPSVNSGHKAAVDSLQQNKIIKGKTSLMKHNVSLDTFFSSLEKNTF